MLSLHSLKPFLLLIKLTLLWKHLHLKLQLLITHFQISFMLLQLFLQFGFFFIFLCSLLQMFSICLVKCLFLLLHILSPTPSLIFSLLRHGLGFPSPFFGLEFVIARTIVSIPQIYGSQF